MRRKILLNMFALAAFSAILSAIVVACIFYNEQYNEFLSEMKSQAKVMASSLNNNDKRLDLSEQEFVLYADELRLTYINADGSVLFDNKVEASRLDNHRNRPEINAALQNGEGEANRLSDTVDALTVYYAIRLDNGDILRVSRDMQSLLAMIKKTVPYIAAACLFCLLISAFLARYRTKRITDPINTLNLDNPAQSDVYEEFTPLIERMEAQRKQISSQIQALDLKRIELTTITENMNEGLLFLDNGGKILSINKKAAEILDTGPDTAGRHFTEITRSPAVFALFKNEDAATDTLLELKNRIYQFFLNPVNIDGKKNGMVLLIMDVTEKMESEKLRREFSANVSHELKTPLTSISGYAEIMKNGLVKQDDIQAFSEKIFNESKRLIALIDDIMKISQLDEKAGGLLWEKGDILNIAQDVVLRLKENAAKKGVRISVYGEKAEMMCVAQIIDEILYNLCSNAIKYNKEQGTVNVSVKQNDSQTVIVVEDTGIGIDMEHQERVFERFYRVDKSHSKKTGGTGLGLSIVKRGVLSHNGEITLESEKNKGTIITVTLPKIQEYLY